MLNRKTVKIGDVFQILTSKGVCYGQVIHTHSKYKYVISIFRDFFDKTPKDFSILVSKEPQIITTFLIQDAVKMGFFALIDNVPVAENLLKFPIFRGTNNLKGDDTIWWFWDGEKEWKVDRLLTDAEKKYPEGPTLISAPLLLGKIENNYRVEVDYI